VIITNIDLINIGEMLVMVPYTYLLVFTHPKTNKQQYYYGVQYGGKSHPDNLWNTYFSSSYIVKYKIKKYGKESFSYEVRKTFDSSEKAKLWEHKVLIKMNVVNNKNWMNRNDNFGPPVGLGKNNPFYGKTHTEETKEKLRKKFRERWSDQKYRERCIESLKNRDNSFLTEEYRKEMSKRFKEYWKNNPDKKQDINGEKNPMWGKKQSKECKEKISKANKGKLVGEKNPMWGKQRTKEVKDAISKFRLGSMWIYNNQLQLCKQIQKDKLLEYSIDGWEPGRKKY